MARGWPSSPKPGASSGSWRLAKICSARSSAFATLGAEELQPDWLPADCLIYLGRQARRGFKVAHLFSDMATQENIADVSVLESL